jgi:hypothetical protein
MSARPAELLGDVSEVFDELMDAVYHYSEQVKSFRNVNIWRKDDDETLSADQQQITAIHARSGLQSGPMAA